MTKPNLHEQEAKKESGVDTPDTALNLRDTNARARPAKDSVDDQIDALILRYESASIRKNGEIKEILPKDYQMNYRQTNFPDEYIFLEGTFKYLKSKNINNVILC